MNICNFYSLGSSEHLKPVGPTCCLSIDKGTTAGDRYKLVQRTIHMRDGMYSPSPLLVPHLITSVLCLPERRIKHIISSDGMCALYQFWHSPPVLKCRSHNCHGFKAEKKQSLVTDLGTWPTQTTTQTTITFWKSHQNDI